MEISQKLIVISLTLCLLLADCASGRTTLLPDPDSCQLAGRLTLEVLPLSSPESGLVAPGDPRIRHMKLIYHVDLASREWDIECHPQLILPGRMLPCRYSLSGRRLTIELERFEDAVGGYPSIRGRNVVIVRLTFSRREQQLLSGPLQGWATAVEIREDESRGEYRSSERWNGPVTCSIESDDDSPPGIRIIYRDGPAEFPED